MKMRTKRTVRQLLSLLAVVTILCQIPVGAIVAPEDSMSATDNTLSLLEEYPEDVSLRTKNEKHFRYGEGGYLAAVYNDPVHYLDSNNEWKDIDNTLKLVTQQANSTLATSSANSYYENTANSFKVRLPKVLTSTTNVLTHYNGYSLSFRLLEMSGVSNAVPNETSGRLLKNELIKRATDAIEIEEKKELIREAITLLPNQTTGLSYMNVRQNTNLVYQIDGQKLKESIILTAPTTQQTFSFAFTYTGLTPVVQEFGAVHFYADDQPDGEPIFIIEAPYMEDANTQEDTLCMDIDVSVTPSATGCIYTMTPNSEWLNDPDRVYPVTIDPTETTPTGATDIEDAGVNQYNPTTNYETVNRMYVGSNLSDGTAYESRIYIRFPKISAISTTALIAKAVMRLDHYPVTSYQTADKNTLDVYEVGEYNWSSSDITWNKQSSYTFSNLVASEETDADNSFEKFNITSLVRKWYKTTASNNGLVIKPHSKDTGKTNRTCYYSSDCDYSYADKRPRIEITYYTPVTISNGYYFVRNRSTGRYVDVQGASTSAGIAIQQLNFLGIERSQWQFSRQSDGCYTIKSKVSNLYVSATNNSSSSGASITQVTSSTGSGARWRIYKNDAGAYIIVSKSSHFCALAVPTSENENGTDLKQTTYSDNTNYRDEWYLGRFIPNVPAEILSNEDHLCIPTAITIIASYWARNGYSGFGGVTTAQMDALGAKVAAEMRKSGGSDQANAYIPNGFSIFSHKSGSTTYKLTPTAYTPANWSTIKVEINAGRPLMLGFQNEVYGGGHMTVCVGYEECGNTKRVYLADGHQIGKYTIKPFSTTENDFMSTVKITTS